MHDAPQDAAPPATAGGDVPQEERTFGMLAHLSALAGIVIPFGNIIGPLVIWLIKKDTMPFVDDQGKESLNFQITVSIALLICFALALVIIGIFLIPIVGIGSLVFLIIGTVKANNGELYRYPLTLRLIK
ncbi:MAG: DUF4870 domain-containing protein [Planctomycetota bacterium]